MELLSVKNACPECGFNHPIQDPHNPQTFYYQVRFMMEHKRSPTWADAMAHCSEEVKQAWIKQLGKLGIDINSTHLTGITTSTEEIEQRLRNKNIGISEQDRNGILAEAVKVQEIKALKRKAQQAKIVAETWQLDDSKKIVKEQMVRCFTCTYGYGTKKGFVCNAFHTDLRIDQMPCPDWEEKS
ncbi:hypothetical protein [Crocosphaera sp. Alani8]|uniref:hypothetical protein n=1 Tax=Crocosphaera sp. Alani8 TaxID=3038952 RepID=UPI00313C5B7E